jgi:hypothetical protein
MLQRLKRPREARDLPGGGGEVEWLRAASEGEVTQSSMRRRQACCAVLRGAAWRVEMQMQMQVHKCFGAAARPLAKEVQQQQHSGLDAAHGWRWRLSTGVNPRR